jgi:hypothetical protein
MNFYECALLYFLKTSFTINKMLEMLALVVGCIS